MPRAQTEAAAGPRVLQRHAKHLIELRSRLAPLKKEFKRLKREFIAEMQAAGEDEILTSLGELKLVQSTREVMDMRRLKQEHPHIYNQLVRAVPVNTLLFDLDEGDEEE